MGDLFLPLSLTAMPGGGAGENFSLALWLGRERINLCSPYVAVLMKINGLYIGVENEEKQNIVAKVTSNLTPLIISVLQSKKKFWKK